MRGGFWEGIQLGMPMETVLIEHILYPNKPTRTARLFASAGHHSGARAEEKVLFFLIPLIIEFLVVLVLFWIVVPGGLILEQERVAHPTQDLLQEFVLIEGLVAMCRIARTDWQKSSILLSILQIRPYFAIVLLQAGLVLTLIASLGRIHFVSVKTVCLLFRTRVLTGRGT